MRHLVPLLLLSACIVRDVTVEEDRTTWADPVDAVLVDVGSGEVSVAVADVSEVEVEHTLSYTGQRPDVDIGVSGGVLRVEDHCRTLQARCSLDVRITLPASAFVEVDTGSGSVSIEGLDDGAVLSTGSGNVDVWDLVGDLMVDTGSGDVSAFGIDAARVEVDTGSGSVNLALDARPALVRVDTGSGNVGIELPSGRYVVDTDTGSGDVSLHGVTADQGADARLEVDTGSGNVDIVGY